MDMEDVFSFLTDHFLQKAEVFPGSIGTFRYRLKRTGKFEKDGEIQAWVYENVCFEQAKDKETLTVPWTAEGMVTLRAWLNERYAARGSEPYSILGGKTIKTQNAPAPSNAESDV